MIVKIILAVALAVAIPTIVAVAAAAFTTPVQAPVQRQIQVRNVPSTLFHRPGRLNDQAAPSQLQYGVDPRGL